MMKISLVSNVSPLQRFGEILRGCQLDCLYFRLEQGLFYDGTLDSIIDTDDLYTSILKREGDGS